MNHCPAKWRYFERYRNEAEPLVVLEALSRGVPVVANGRGCFPALQETGGGCVVSVNERFASVATEVLGHWARDEDGFKKERRRAAQRFSELRAESTRGLEKLLVRLESA